MGPSIQWSKQSLTAYKLELEKLIKYYINNPNCIPFSMLRLDIDSIKQKQANVKTCSCGEDLICVDCSGKTYACHLFSPVAMPKDKADKSNLIYDFKNRGQFQSPVCSRCLLNTICNHCYGMNYICTDDVRTPSSFHCSAFKILFAANCKYRMTLAVANNDLKTISIINSITSKIA